MENEKNKYDNVLRSFTNGTIEIFDEPRPFENYFVASDRYIAVRIDKSKCNGEYSEHKRQPTSWNRVFGEPSGTPFVLNVHDLAKAINDIPESETIDVTGSPDVAECSECEGSGYVEWTYESKDGEEYSEIHDCPVCQGRGKFDKRTFKREERNFGINGAWFNVGHLMTVINAIYQLGHDTATIVRFPNHLINMLINVEPGVDMIIASNTMIEPAASITLKPTEK